MASSSIAACFPWMADAAEMAINANTSQDGSGNARMCDPEMNAVQTGGRRRRRRIKMVMYDRCCGGTNGSYLEEARSCAPNLKCMCHHHFLDRSSGDCIYRKWQVITKLPVDKRLFDLRFFRNTAFSVLKGLISIEWHAFWEQYPLCANVHMISLNHAPNFRPSIFNEQKSFFPEPMNEWKGERERGEHHGRGAHHNGTHTHLKQQQQLRPQKKCE